jgi:pre-mRNA-splicing factor 18
LLIHLHVQQSKSATPEAGSPSADKAGESSSQKEVFNISTSEAIRRLRSKGEPIRLFGESDKERRLRLRALELIEERGEKVGQNDFMRALKGAESSIVNEELQGKKKDSKKAKGDDVKEGEESSAQKEADEGAKQREGVGMSNLLDLGLLKKDISKVYPIIYYTLKGLLRDWEQALAERPSECRSGVLLCCLYS